MNASRRTAERASLGLFSALLLAAAPASQPVLDRSVASGLYFFKSPPAPDWTAVKPDPASDSMTFLNAKHDGAIQIELLPKDARVDADISGSVAVAIIKELNRQRAETHAIALMAPKVEHDRRFEIVIHEKYKSGETICDQLHVYKSVGPRVLMLTVNSVAADASASTAIHKAGEDALDSARFNRKAFQKSH